MNPYTKTPESLMTIPRLEVEGLVEREAVARLVDADAFDADPEIFATKAYGSSPVQAIRIAEDHLRRRKDLALSKADQIAALYAGALARVGEERDEAREHEAYAKSTLSAWFDLAKKIEADALPTLADGFKGYLRTSMNGGMPTEMADAAKNAFAEYCRLYAGRDLVPVLRGMSEAQAVKAEADAAWNTRPSPPAIEGEWKPIETAPRDGTRIDLWVQSTEFPRESRYTDAHWNANAGEWQLGQFHVGQYVDRPVVTHWRPLPSPPITGTGEPS